MTMQWTTQELPIIANDTDLTNALALYEQLANKEGSDQQFLYLLSLIIADYEAQHYPVAVSSTVDFIDHLLEERNQTWDDIHKVLGCFDSEDIYSVRGNIEHEFISMNDLRALSHFFKLPTQAFIVGGYGE